VSVLPTAMPVGFESGPGGAGRDDQDPAGPDSHPSWWRRNAGLVVIATVLVLLLVVAGLALRTDSGVPLDPRSPAPEGSRAVAQILRDQGVEVRALDRLDTVLAEAGPSTTVVLVDRSLTIPRDRLVALGDSGADLALPSAAFVTLLELAPEVVQSGSIPGPPPAGDRVAPGCADADATAAGEITYGGDGLVAAPSPSSARTVTVCYVAGAQPAPDAGTFAVVEGPDSRVTVIGNTEILTNARLDEAGNAALALRALGRQPTVLWYLADPFDPALATGAEAAPTPESLLPPWVRWVAIQLLVAALIAIVWRYRRLGALVPEGLPAIVRSVETAEGRARLYRRAGSRDRAAALLRIEAARALGQRLGARRGATATDIARLTATATGRDPVAVVALLAGPPPPDDAALIALADDLDALTASLRPTGAPRTPVST